MELQQEVTSHLLGEEPFSDLETWSEASVNLGDIPFTQIRREEAFPLEN